MSRQYLRDQHNNGYGYNEGLHIPPGEFQRRARSPYRVQSPELIPPEQRVVEVGSQEDGSFHIIPLRDVT